MSSGTGNPTIDNILIVMAEDLLKGGEGPIYGMVFALCFVGGCFLMMKSLIGLTRAVAAGPMGMKSAYSGPVAGMVVAVMLVSLKTFIDVGTETMFMGHTSPLAWSELNSQVTEAGGLDEHAQRVIYAVISLMQMVGLLAVIRGLLMFKSHAEGNHNAGVGAASTHIVGGILAINMGELIKMLEATFNITVGLGMEFGGMPDFSAWFQ